MPIICGNSPPGYGIISLTINVGGRVGGSGAQSHEGIFNRNRTP